MNIIDAIPSIINLHPIRMRVTVAMEYSMYIAIHGGVKYEDLNKKIEEMYPGYVVWCIKQTEYDTKNPRNMEQVDLFRKIVSIFLTVDLHKKGFEDFLNEDY